MVAGAFALFLEGSDEVVEAVERLVSPHYINHVLRQLAHHVGVLCYNVAPHGNRWEFDAVVLLDIAMMGEVVGLIDDFVAAVDVVDIDLVGAEGVDELACTAGAELLGLVAIDDEIGRVGVLTDGLDDAVEEEVVGLFGSGVKVGAAVHQVLIEWDAEGLLGVGQELEVDDLVGVALGGSVGGGEVGVILLIESVFGVVVAEVVFEGMECVPLLLAVGIVGDGAAALVVHPTS